MWSFLSPSGYFIKINKISPRPHNSQGAEINETSYKHDCFNHSCCQPGTTEIHFRVWGWHYKCKHHSLLHSSLLWQPFLLNTTLGNKKEKKEPRSSNLCLEIKHWLSNARLPVARLWGWFDSPLRWWEIRSIPPNHMPETVQLHSNS